MTYLQHIKGGNMRNSLISLQRLVVVIILSLSIGFAVWIPFTGSQPAQPPTTTILSSSLSSLSFHIRINGCYESEVSTKEMLNSNNEIFFTCSNLLYKYTLI